MPLINKKRINYSLLKELQKAKGERTLGQFAEDAGVCLSSLSRIMSGERFPKPGTIEKLTSQKAAPQNGVTYETLMAAAGYVSAQSKNGNDFGETGSTKGDVNLDFIPSADETRTRRLTAYLSIMGQSMSRQESKRFADLAFPIISAQYSKKNIDYIIKPVEDRKYVRTADICLKSKLGCELFYFVTGGSYAEGDIMACIQAAAFIPKEYRIRIIIDDRLLFNYISTALKGKLSVAIDMWLELFDFMTYSIVKRSALATAQK